MISPAPYTRETVQDIRVRSKSQELHAIALALGWDEARVKTIAARHSIEITETKLPKEAAVVQPSIPVKSVVPPAQQKPSRPGVRKRMPRAAVEGHPRIEYTTVALSKSAMENLAAIRQQGGKSIAGVAGIVIDYVARHGKVPKLFKAALKEMSQ